MEEQDEKELEKFLPKWYVEVRKLLNKTHDR